MRNAMVSKVTGMPALLLTSYATPLRATVSTQTLHQGSDRREEAKHKRGDQCLYPESAEFALAALG